MRALPPFLPRALARPAGGDADVGRPLTGGEWRALSAGLAQALRRAECAPVIVPRAHPGARAASLWRGHVPILARRAAIWWPGAAEDFSVSGRERAMAILQHELQHVLEFATGELTTVGYLTRPRNWSYRWRPTDGRPWSALGAEQRACAVERLWLSENGLAPRDEASALRGLIPWA